MAGFGRAVVIALLAVSSLMLFLNIAFFFPWYFTLVEKGFAISQMIATDNYLRSDYYNDIMYEFQYELPIFCEYPDDITIEAWHIDEGRTAIESETPGRKPEDYYGEAYTPYVQMGCPVRISLSASYPLRMMLFGRDIHELLPLLPNITASFNLTTTTTKHYKDLEYTYTEAPDPSTWVDDDHFEWESEDPYDS